MGVISQISCALLVHVYFVVCKKNEIKTKCKLNKKAKSKSYSSHIRYLRYVIERDWRKPSIYNIPSQQIYIDITSRNFLNGSV